MSSLERSASAGLAALVISDLLFCAVGLPQLFVPERLDPTIAADGIPLARFAFYYEMYRGPLHNVFLLCSTWIVTIITAERYLAVSRPIRARLLTIRLRRTLFFYVAVFSLSAVVALPLFLKYRAVEGDCVDGKVLCRRSCRWKGPLRSRRPAAVPEVPCSRGRLCRWKGPLSSILSMERSSPQRSPCRCS